MARFGRITLVVALLIPSSVALGFSYPRNWTQVLMPGQGFDPLAVAGDRAKALHCFNVERAPDYDPGPLLQFDTKIDSDFTSYLSTLGVTAEGHAFASFYGGDVTVDARYQATRSLQFSTNTVVFSAFAQEQAPTVVYRQLDLTGTGSAIAKWSRALGREYFYDTCGREFVLQIQRLKRVVVSFKLETSSKQVSESIAARLQTAWNYPTTDGRVSVLAQREWSAALASAHYEVKFETYGGPGLSFLGPVAGQPTDLQLVLDTLKDWLSKSDQTEAADFSYSTTSAAYFLEQNADTYGEVAEYTRQLLDELRLSGEQVAVADQVVQEPGRKRYRKYIPDPTGTLIGAYDGLREKWLDYRIKLQGIGQECLKGTVELKETDPQRCNPAERPEQPARIELPEVEPPFLAQCTVETVFGVDGAPYRNDLIINQRFANRDKEDVDVYWINGFRNDGTQVLGNREHWASPTPGLQAVELPELGMTVSMDAGAYATVMYNNERPVIGCDRIVGTNAIRIRDFDGTTYEYPAIQIFQSVNGSTICNPNAQPQSGCTWTH